MAQTQRQEQTYSSSVETDQAEIKYGYGPNLRIPLEDWPNVSHLITEDDTPVDNVFSEKQQRLLTESLYNGWQTELDFVAFANVGLYFSLGQDPIVPDMLLSTGVKVAEDVWKKYNRSIWFGCMVKPLK